MFKTRLSILAAALLATGLSAAEDPKPAPTENVNIAVVNGVAYPLDLFRIYLVERLQEAGAQGQDEQALQQSAFNDFMTLVVASQEANRRKLAEVPEIAAALEVQRMKVMANAALGAMAQDMAVSEEELQKAYEEVKKSAARTEYKARHILVKDEAEAKKIIKELDKGADFAELAKKKSEAPGGKNGGELDWFDANQMAKPFADAVAAMKPGTYSKEPVQTQFGWHVIHLQETRTGAPPKFEDAKPQLTILVQRQKLSQEINKLRDSAMVELNESVVKVTPKEDEASDQPGGKDEAKQ